MCMYQYDWLASLFRDVAFPMSLKYRQLVVASHFMVIWYTSPGLSSVSALICRGYSQQQLYNILCPGLELGARAARQRVP